MPIHGRARDRVIAALGNRDPKLGTSSAMSALKGRTYGYGWMPASDRDQYKFHADAGNVVYTVMSYDTPIAYVLADGKVIVPDVSYSPTTTGHQTLCRVYL